MRVSSVGKNLFGWHTRKRIVVFAVDDYGTVRLADRTARETLRDAIPCFGGPMDTLDALETRDDLDALFEALSSVRDGNGRPAVFTAYALPANPDFDRMREDRRYAYELLPTTLQRLEADQPHAYGGTWALWRQGMREGLIHPQFHGREHVSVPLLEAKLRRGDPDLTANVNVRSMAGLHGVPEMPGVGFTHSFGIHNASLLSVHRDIIADGLRRFGDVFGFVPDTFTPPAQKLHPDLESYVVEQGIRSIDKPFISRRSLGGGRSRPSVQYLRPGRGARPSTVVRTLAFEPAARTHSDPVPHALREISTAFAMRKPAIVSSHRVNYVGHVEPANRTRGLGLLRELLHGIVKRWPDVVFMTMDELVAEMEGRRGQAA